MPTKAATGQDETEDLVDALAQAAFTVMAALTRIAADHDLSLTQLRVFGILRDHQPRMAELADYLGLEKSTMSGLITRAEQRGLVERHKDPADARASVVAMTGTGLDLAARVLAEVRAALSPLTDHLPGADRDTLAHLLTRLLANTHPLGQSQ